MLLLAIDDAAWPARKQVCLHLSKPRVRAEAVVTPAARESAAPDNCAAMFYGTVLRDGGRFRMWYHACHFGMNPDWPPDTARQFAKYRDPVLLGPPCYAESEDGIAWRKVELGRTLFKGDRRNNALDLPHGLTAGVCVIKDEEDPDPDRRYKMVYQFFPRFSDPPLAGQGRMSTIATAVSPDGLGWRFTGVPFVDQFIEPSSFYKHDGKYIVTYQAGDAWGSHFGEGGRTSGRQGLARYSPDFERWVDGYVESLVLPEPAENSARGAKGDYVQNHLGVGAASFGNVCVGLYGLWHNKPVFHDIWCDFGLAVSQDGLRFREPAQGHIFLAASESPAEPAAARTYRTNLCQANGILNFGEETRIYHGRWRNTGWEYVEDYYGSVALATLPRDRWGALVLFPNREEGSFWSAPVALGPEGLRLNAEGGAGISVEMADERFGLIAAHSGAKAGRPAGEGGLELRVLWPDGAPDLPRGARVRLKVNLRRAAGVEPRLYAAMT
jgi:hypothetical protein